MSVIDTLTFEQQQEHITYAATSLYNDNDIMCISISKQIIQCQKEYMGQITA